MRRGATGALRQRLPAVLAVGLVGLLVFRVVSVGAWVLLARAQGATTAEVQEYLEPELEALRLHARARAGLVPETEATALAIVPGRRNYYYRVRTLVLRSTKSSGLFPRCSIPSRTCTSRSRPVGSRSS